MQILPGFSKTSYFQTWSSEQIKIFAVERYFLIVLYSFLFALVNYNVYSILICKRNYKTWPLLAFYVFSYIAISFRLFYIIFEFDLSIKTGVNILEYLAPEAKLCVGLMQSWMIFEIALHLKVSRDSNDDSDDQRMQKMTCIGQCLVIAFACVYFITFIILAIITSQQPGKDGNPFSRDSELSYVITGYSFLFMFILMALANFYLSCQIHARNKAQIGQKAYKFDKERCNLTILLVFFELSYLFRFILDTYFGYDIKSDFTFYLTYDILFYMDCLSFSALLLFHARNFRVVGKKNTTQPSNESLGDQQVVIPPTTDFSPSSRHSLNSLFDQTNDDKDIVSVTLMKRKSCKSNYSNQPVATAYEFFDSNKVKYLQQQQQQQEQDAALCQTILGSNQSHYFSLPSKSAFQSSDADSKDSYEQTQFSQNQQATQDSRD